MDSTVVGNFFIKIQKTPDKWAIRIEEIGQPDRWAKLVMWPRLRLLPRLTHEGVDIDKLERPLWQALRGEMSLDTLTYHMEQAIIANKPLKTGEWFWSPRWQRGGSP